MINVYLKKAEDELRLRNYSPKTIKNYIACLADYLCAKQGRIYAEAFEKAAAGYSVLADVYVFL